MFRNDVKDRLARALILHAALVHALERLSLRNAQVAAILAASEMMVKELERKAERNKKD